MTNTNILITGVSGFMGSNLKSFIKEEYPSWRIYGVDRTTKKVARTFKIDVNNKKKVRDILCKIKPAYIFHLAGVTASDDFKRLLLSNVVSTFTVLEAIKEIKDYRPRIVIPSSAAEYGAGYPLGVPLKEDYLLNPISLYGFSKAMQTQLSLMFAEKGLDVVVGRMFNIVGRGVPITLSLGKFARELALMKKGKRRAVMYTKNLDTRRDFLDIKDACRYLTAVAIHGKKGEVYNICRGRSYLIRYLLNKLISISGIRNIKIIEDKECGKESDLTDSFGSTKKVKKIANLPTLISIDKSLRDTYSYYFLRS